MSLSRDKGEVRDSQDTLKILLRLCLDFCVADCMLVVEVRIVIGLGPFDEAGHGEVLRHELALRPIDDLLRKYVGSFD